MTTMAEATLGVILAGGQGRRMEGADKAFVRLAERPLFDHVLSRLAPQVDAVIVNANGDPARFADYDLPVVADTVDGFAGPLAGVLAAMEWAAAHRPACRYLVTAATDAPFLPRDLVAQFHRVVADLGLNWYAPVPMVGRIRFAGCGRSTCWMICGTRWSTRACVKWTCGPCAIGWPMWLSTTTVATRFSMSIDRPI